GHPKLSVKKLKFKKKILAVSKKSEKNSKNQQ
uniref:Uncharacterized protein n=1 Tax=Amphimedon queenslandica TaxID=400682 RepID=A0A1X7UW47_AMPQE